VSYVDLVSLLLPHLAAVQVRDVLLRGRTVHVQALAVSSQSTCPGCGQASGRRHSRYRRRLADCAMGGREVQIELTVSRFFCDEPDCPARTFVEQVDGLTVPYGRRTGLAAQMVEAVALMLGGRAGSRLAEKLATPVGRATMVRVIRRIPEAPVKTPRVLGVDTSRNGVDIVTPRF
jgi:hypothetical protein